MPGTRVLAIPLEDIDSATVLITYLPINTGLPKACFLVRVINGSNASIFISYDGVTDHDLVFANSILTIPSERVTSLAAQSALFAKGLVIYARGTAGVGTIGISGYYVNLP